MLFRSRVDVGIRLTDTSVSFVRMDRGINTVIEVSREEFTNALPELVLCGLLLELPRSRKDRFNELVAIVCNGGTSDDAANVQFTLEPNYVRMTICDRIGAHTLMAVVDKHRELFGDEDFFID